MIHRRAATALVALTWLGLALAMTAGPAFTQDPLDERLRWRIESMLLAERRVVHGTELHAFDGVRQLYANRAFAPMWTSPGGTEARLDTLILVLREDERFGLPACVYHVDSLVALSERSRLTDGSRVDVELLATDAALTHASHVALGRVSPETFDPEWFAVRRELDAVSMLADAVVGDSLGAALRGLHPRYPGYRRLAATYDVLRRAGGTLPPAPEPGPALRAGDDPAETAALAARLAALGDLTPESAPGDSAALDAAIRRFQTRHGLDVDGVVGAETRRWLSLETTTVARTLALNLERWRWLPADLGARHVRVNIAGFSLELVEGSHVVRTERVVVGKAYRRTPVFTGSIRYVVLNPSWEVPPGILEKDLVPALKKDPSILATRGMALLAGWGTDEHVVDPAAVDWARVRPRAFPYRVRQRPGPLNPLGSAKLIFPNRFNVYIHDTNDRSLFARSTRSMSSGCIRVEHPLEVTAWALADSARWSMAALEAAVATGEEQTVPLRRPLPVHVLYWTAWIDEAGTLNLRQDLYGRDRSLDAALAEVEACE